MILLGVMLSTGPGSEKAQVLFEAYDPDLSGYMTKATFLKMIDDIFFII
jgi:Ca2+-binding EF-hand superfamily protein